MADLRLHHLVYSGRALEEASQAFAEVAEVEVRQQMPYFEVTLRAREADTDPEALRGEFANYVLALTIEERRGGHR
ncbi:MAG: hypothetical protein D6729_17895 [Deltaproteobacteria bacterium]|nr:MAG: hypothetical protein D6729_17895 [Deltaproteobacteria bacterium]